MTRRYTMSDARLNVSFRTVSESEGFCNAFAPIIDAIDSMIEEAAVENGDEFYESTKDATMDYVKRVIEVCSIAVDVAPESTDREALRIKIDNLIKDLEDLK